MRKQNSFDAEVVAAVVHVMRFGDERLVDSALGYLEQASSETGVDHFFGCCDDKRLEANSLKRVRFLEALRDTDQKFPADYFKRLNGWLTRADSYYEVHLLLSLLEREGGNSEAAVNEAILLLRSKDALVVRRSQRFLKTQELNASQQRKVDAFEKRR